MSDGFKIKSDKVIENFKKALDLSKNIKPLMLKILGDEESNLPWTMRGSVIKSFKDQVSPGTGGLAWAPLSPKYAAKKAKKYPGMPTLVASGKLFNSLARKGEGSVGPAFKDTTMVWGTSIYYAQYHQSIANRTTLPRRAFLNITKEQKKAWNILLAQYIKDTMTGVDPEKKALS